MESSQDADAVAYMMTEMQLHNRVIAPCANTTASSGDNKANCPSKATKICGRCKLVAYCSSDCQAQHWATHKADCNAPVTKADWVPRWAQQHRGPDFVVESGPRVATHGGTIKGYLWGNVPALDILNLEQNEGSDYQSDLSLCFAASGNLRNLLATIFNLPSTYIGQLSVTLNDRDVRIVLLNLTILLLFAMEEIEAAVDAVLHFWYSARVKESHTLLMERYVQQIIDDVVPKIQNKRNDLVQAKTVHIGSTRVRIALVKSQWIEMQSILARKYELETAEKSRRATVLHREDHLDRNLFEMRRDTHRRLGKIRYRERGVLLPFGDSDSQYTDVNPMLVNTDGEWMQKDSADPLQGWTLRDLEAFSKTQSDQSTLSNDLYGQLGFYLMHKLSRLHKRMRNQRLHITLHCLDAKVLNTYVEHGQMDRIEVSNIVDGGWLGAPTTLRIMRPLLRERNRHATIIGLFINALQEMEHRHEADRGIIASSISSSLPFLQLDPASASHKDRHNPEFRRMTFAKHIFAPLDRWWLEYMQLVRLEQNTRKEGMKMKNTHTIVDKWSFRLFKKYGEPGAQEAYDYLLASDVAGCERYVEWVRA